MKRFFRFDRLLLAAVLASVAAWPLAQAASAGPPAPEVPDAVEVGEGHKVFLVGHAVGVQIHECKGTAGAYRWDFVAPRADLYDDHGKLIVTHFGGPTWQAKDGSEVVAARVDGITVEPSAIPWLLLATTSTAAGADGDRLTATTYIQRIATTGGLAPAATGCNASTAGTTAEVPYTADYLFWKATGK